jgi:hypothetical protein
MAVQTQIQTRRGAAATWTSTNPTLAAGEIGFESDTNKFKIGTGSTAWASLPYASNVSPLTTKGDLYTYSTDNDRLAVGANGETLVADSSTSTGLRYQANFAGAKNLQMNGNMNIAQRGTSFAGVVNDYTLDRFNCRNNTLGAFTVSKETDAPVGFGSSMKWLCTTADASPAAADFAVLRTTYEGQQLQALAKGTASAKTTVMSFWVKSNLTGTYLFSIFDADNTRRISATYTINASATWEKKSITIAGDTTGALDNDANASMQLQWVLGSGTDRTSGTYQSTWGANVTANEYAGQTANVAATLNNYWMVTGIQWEIGNVGTEFQLSTGTIQGELSACQRYFQTERTGNTPLGTAAYWTTTLAYLPYALKTTMRVAPTVTFDGVAAVAVFCNGVSRQSTAIGTDTVNVNFVEIVPTTGAVTGGDAAFVRLNVTDKFINFSAEL